jgi:hypothetical protein
MLNPNNLKLRTYKQPNITNGSHRVTLCGPFTFQKQRKETLKWKQYYNHKPAVRTCFCTMGPMLLIERSRLLREPRAFATFMNRKKAGQCLSFGK